MNLRQIAKMIPDEYRKEILLMNMIDKAQAVNTNPDMIYLGVIWKNYVDRNYSSDCNLCCADLLKNYKSLKQTFIDLEKESNLLKEA